MTSLDVIPNETGRLHVNQDLGSPASRPMEDNVRRLVVRNSLIAGSCSGIVSTLALYPMDILRIKMQQQSSLPHHGPFQVLQTTVQNGGIRALYTGLTLPLLAQTVYKSTVFTVSNVTEQSLKEYRAYENSKAGIEQSTVHLMDKFFGGFVGGAVNAFLFVTPVEFVRNQMIVQQDTKRVSSLSTEARQADAVGNMWNVVRTSIKQERGFLSLWRGASWAVYRDAIGCGCFFYSMEYCQQILTPAHEKPTFVSTVISGGISGLAFWVVALPFDTIKTWVQSSDVSKSQISTRKTIESIYHEVGLTGLIQRLFRGWQVAYSRGIPSAAIIMTTYSLVYRYLSSPSS